MDWLYTCPNTKPKAKGSSKITSYTKAGLICNKLVIKFDQ